MLYLHRYSSYCSSVSTKDVAIIQDIARDNQKTTDSLADKDYNIT